jgi:hypothetical protein
MTVIELQYLPQAAYVAQFLIHKDLIIDGYEHYVKQTYRNRCRILTANGVDQLSVPVQGSGKKILARDIRIDYSQKWLNRHWRAIKSAYGRAPYFEYYAEDYAAIFNKRPKFLFDLSLEILTQCLDHLHYDIEIYQSEAFIDSPEINLKDQINPKLSQFEDISYEEKPYQQVFGSKFVEQLSIIDLIFCEGPQAGDLLRSGIK